MKYMSLNAWAKREGIICSTSQKMVKDGKIPGVILEVRGKITRIKVPEDFHLEKSDDEVTCQICLKKFPQITPTHLKTHNLSFDEYKEKFPNSAIVNEEIREFLKEKFTNREVSEETRKLISEKRTGVVPKNHPRFVIGSFKHSEETKQKMSQIHSGLKHTEESKKKIGDAHRGKTIKPEAIEKFKVSIAKYYETHDAAFKGKSHTEENKKFFSEAMKIYHANMTPEEKAEAAKIKSAALTGKVRTPEMKKRYAEVRSKWMEKNWEKSLKTTSKGELLVRKWFTDNGYEIKPQYRIPGQNHPYDLYVPELNLIVEFDGAHHWKEIWWATKLPVEEREILLEAQQDKDDDETEFAIQNGYYIIRIRAKSIPGDSHHGTLEEQIINGLSVIFEEEGY